MDEQASYERARRRVHQIRGFYVHATVYALVNALLVAVNLTTSAAHLWFVWPLLGWGVGVLAHGVSVFGAGGIWGREWEERKIRELQQRDRVP
jgi:hypothetical protein